MENETIRRSLASASKAKVPFLEYVSAHRGENRRRCLIYFIPGNPGLIAYYAPFLSTLRQLLDEEEARDGCHRSFHVYGQNLIGFDDADHEPPFSAAEAGTAPFVLEDQIFHSYDRLVEVGTNGTNVGSSEAAAQAQAFDEVIIMGHSVGAYISTEIYHRHHLQLKARQQQQVNGNDGTGVTEKQLVNLQAGILLFPTISDMAHSPNGQKLDFLRTTPFLDRYAHRVAKGFVDLWPGWLLEGFVRRVLGQPAHAASVTVRFLMSRDGIWQALHLGKDEMRVITEEKWSEDLWEMQDDDDTTSTTDAATERPNKFFFYFGVDDSWVSQEHRDRFIEQRRRHENGRTRIFIDQDKIPHAFCIRELPSFSSFFSLDILSSRCFIFVRRRKTD
ncbi:hypothetical protein B0H63DRAFT_305785 [Podospora didyma]|uniref:Uncharacterized protein n=1 Tax=Podospora didyma TaxID=330526 RepID=A0AAE0K4R2_9PEZI|nr:hypothetical protein B0H63DRAFT_305785 [Podospora didyma]